MFHKFAFMLTALLGALMQTKCKVYALTLNYQKGFDNNL